jgi:hypothetical protein
MSEVSKILRAAALNRALLVLWRPFDPHPLHGFAVGLGEWLLLHRLDPDSLTLNGYTAVRSKDVNKVELHAQIRDSFMVRATRKLRPKTQSRISLMSTRSLLETAARGFPLVTLNPEKRDDGVCFIGKPMAFPGASVELREVDPDGHWREENRRFQLRSITKVDFGGGYETALAESAG